MQIGPTCGIHHIPGLSALYGGDNSCSMVPGRVDTIADSRNIINMVL